MTVTLYCEQINERGIRRCRRLSPGAPRTFHFPFVRHHLGSSDRRCRPWRERFFVLEDGKDEEDDGEDRDDGEDGGTRTTWISRTTNDKEEDDLWLWYLRSIIIWGQL